MIERFFGLLRKRQKLDTDSDTDLCHDSDEQMVVDSKICGGPPQHSDSTWAQEDMDIDAPQDITNLNIHHPINDIVNPPPMYRDHCAMGSEAAAGSSKWTTEHDDCKAHVDDRGAIDRPLDLNERFVNVLDQLDRRVEKFRKDAVSLQEKRDFLLMSIDLIKNNEVLQGMSEHEKEDIGCYIHRVNCRLSTVELNVRTVRDTAQEDSLHQVNVLIDSLITSGDPGNSRQRCQSFLNACSASDMSLGSEAISQNFVDKNFENALLGCTLDDQKNIKKRLQALMTYLNKQIISD